MINGEEYSFEDIRIILDGEPIVGFDSIEYDTDKEHFNMNGKGNKPVSARRGKESYSASLGLFQSVLEKLQRRLPKGKKLTDMRGFNVVVAYAPEGGIVTTDILHYCRITKVTKGLKSSSGEDSYALPLLPGDIEYNV